MGTPDFAVATLDALLKANFDIAAVVTAPDRPAGRGQKISESAVKQYAVSNNLKVLQPEKLKAPEFVQALKDLEADLFVVVAFRMLPEVVWNMPPKGTINLHGSLLPKYRGAAPINWAVINGEKETGVTTFFLQHEIDTGDIINQATLPIDDDDTAGNVHDEMMLIGAKLVVKTVEEIAANKVNPMPQVFNGEIPHAPKIFRPDCRIDWANDVQDIYNKIRGLSPYPGAWTTLEGKTFKLIQCTIVKEDNSFENGQLLVRDNELLVACKGGFINVLQLQLEGKKRMKTSEFLKGYGIEGKALV